MESILIHPWIIAKIVLATIALVIVGVVIVRICWWYISILIGLE